MNQEDIQILQRLGLTGSQARVYLSLVKLKRANARNLWKTSKVARQDIYRILTELREIGILEKILEAPTQFKAVPLEDSVKILLERKTKAIFSLEKDADKLVQKFKENEEKKVHEEEAQYILIPEREALSRRLRKAIEDTQKSIDIISSSKAFARSFFVLSEEFGSALRRNVKIRWIINEPEEANPLLEHLQILTKDPNFKLKTIKYQPNVRLGIYDKKGVFMAHFPIRKALESPALWSINLGFVEIVQGFFETIWHSAMEIKPKKD